MSFGKNHFVKVQSLCLFLLLIVLTACSTSSSTPSPAITGSTAPGLKNCRPPSSIDNSSSGPEVQGTATNAELWGLLESDSGVPPLTGTEVKIVWRMTGSGNFTIVAVGPYGMKLPPSQGPDEHPASSWSRPGDEWGTVFTFPVAGCWDLHATRDNAFGDVWLEIVDWYL